METVFLVNERYSSLGGYDETAPFIFRTRESARKYIDTSVNALKKNGYEVTSESENNWELRNNNWSFRSYTIQELKIYD